MISDFPRAHTHANASHRYEDTEGGESEEDEASEEEPSDDDGLEGEEENEEEEEEPVAEKGSFISIYTPLCICSVVSAHCAPSSFCHPSKSWPPTDSIQALRRRNARLRPLPLRTKKPPQRKMAMPRTASTAKTTRKKPTTTLKRRPRRRPRPAHLLPRQPRQRLIRFPRSRMLRLWLKRRHSIVSCDCSHML